MNRTILACSVLALLGGCTAVVSDLNGFTNNADACDPRGTPHLGEDLEIQFLNTTAHINQDMRFAIEVGAEREIDAMFIVSAFDDPNLTLRIPEVLPAAPATLAFWADSNANGTFDPIPMPGAMGTPDHQWFRPICPDGQMTFTHTTPFQDISMARSVGLIWRFEVPAELQRSQLFDTFRIAAWAVRVNDLGRQTRAYYLRQPFVPLGGTTPPQRMPPTVLQVGGNVGTEPRGAIDDGEVYEINFVIDVDRDEVMGSAGDYVCQWTDQHIPPAMMRPDMNVWDYVPPSLTVCDRPAGFDPVTFMP